MAIYSILVVEKALLSRDCYCDLNAPQDLVGEGVMYLIYLGNKCCDTWDDYVSEMLTKYWLSNNVLPFTQTSEGKSSHPRQLALCCLCNPRPNSSMAGSRSNGKPPWNHIWLSTEFKTFRRLYLWFHIEITEKWTKTLRSDFSSALKLVTLLQRACR